MRRAFNIIWDKWANWHPFLRFLIVLVLLTLIGFFAGLPSYRALKKWRVEQKITSASKAIQADRMDEARDLSLSVLQEGDARIEAFRVLQQSMEALQDPRQSDIARFLLQHPKGTDADRLQGLRSVAPVAPMGLLGQAWGSLPKSNQQDPEFIVLLADRLLSEGMVVDAAKLLKTDTSEHTPLPVRERFIRVLILDGSSEGYAEAQKRIVTDASSLGFETTMDLLESLPVESLNAALLVPCLEKLAPTTPSQEARAALFQIRLQLSANFEARAAILQETINHWRDAAPAELAKFLADLGLQQLLVESIPVEQAASHPTILPYLLNAYIETSSVDKLEFLLDQQMSNMPRHELFAYRSFTAELKENASLSNQHWSTAMEEAKSSNSPNAYLDLFRIAQRTGMRSRGELALVEAIRLGRGPLPLYNNLRPLLESLFRQNRENEIMMICSRYFAFEPNNAALLSQYAYLACIHDMAAPETLLKAARPLAEQYKDAQPVQFVLITLQLCAGLPQEALATLERMNPNLDTLSPTHRIAYLVTLVMNQKMAPDDPRIARFPWDKLLLSEQRKYAQLLKKTAPTEK